VAIHDAKEECDPNECDYPEVQRTTRALLCCKKSPSPSFPIRILGLVLQYSISATHREQPPPIALNKADDGIASSAAHLSSHGT